MKFFLINDSILLSIIVWAFVVVLLVLLFKHRARVASFTLEVKTELQKATWPWDPKEKAFGAKYKELIDSTVVVIIAMILLSAFVAIADFALLFVNKALFS